MRNLPLPWQASTASSSKPWGIGSFSGSWSDYPIRVFADHALEYAYMYTEDRMVDRGASACDTE